jgi:hypothetical protein
LAHRLFEKTGGMLKNQFWLRTKLLEDDIGWKLENMKGVRLVTKKLSFRSSQYEVMCVICRAKISEPDFHCGTSKLVSRSSGF